MAKIRRTSFVAAHPGHAESRVNPHASSPDETCLSRTHTTNPFAINFSTHAQRVHQLREISHSADTLPALIGSSHLAPLEKRHEPCRADMQDADKMKLQLIGQGFVDRTRVC